MKRLTAVVAGFGLRVANDAKKRNQRVAATGFDSLCGAGLNLRQNVRDALDVLVALGE